MNNYVDQFVNWVKSTFGYASTKNTASAHTRGKRIVIRQTPPNTKWVLAQPRNKKDQRLPTKIIKTNNQSPTAGLSDKLEERMYAGMQSNYIGRNRGYDIRKLKGQPSYKILGHNVDQNVLDSITKYGAIYNRKPFINPKPISQKNKYQKPRKLSLQEIYGLPYQESVFGRTPLYNTKPVRNDQDRLWNRAVMNTNFLDNFGFIPAEAMYRNWHYGQTNPDIPPILDAYSYYAEGDYNRGSDSHTKDVNRKGLAVIDDPEFKRYWNQHGEKYYNSFLK